MYLPSPMLGQGVPARRPPGPGAAVEVPPRYRGARILNNIYVQAPILRTVRSLRLKRSWWLWPDPTLC